MFSYMKRGRGFYREVALLSAPIVLQNLITNMLGMADTFMVGLLGEAPMAAVTLANIPVFMLHLFIFGVQSGSSVLYGQYWGKRDLESINRVLGVAVWLVLIVTSLFAAVLWICPVQFLSLFGNEPAVIELAAEYGRIIGLSCVFDAVVIMYITVHRSIERPDLGLYILVTSMLVNTFLNWVFIFGNLGAPEMGVAGAAFATLIARILEVIMMAVHIMSKPKDFRVNFRLLFRPGGDMTRRFARYGLPVVCNETLWGIGTSAYTTVMGHMSGSTEILAAYTIAGNVDKICAVMSFGLGATTAIIIGREVGAGRVEKVKEVGYTLATLSLIFGGSIGILLVLFAVFVAPTVVFPMFKLSAGAASVAVMMMVMRGLSRAVQDFNGVVITGVLRGGGDVKTATLVDLIPLWAMGIPLAFLCGIVLKLDIFWVYLIIVLEQLVKAAVGLWRMRSGKWVKDLTRPVGKEHA